MVMAPMMQARIPKTMLMMVSLAPVEDENGCDEVGEVGTGLLDVFNAMARMITSKGAMTVIGCLVVAESRGCKARDDKRL